MMDRNENGTAGIAKIISKKRNKLTQTMNCPKCFGMNTRKKTTNENILNEQRLTIKNFLKALKARRSRKLKTEKSERKLRGKQQNANNQTGAISKEREKPKMFE